MQAWAYAYATFGRGEEVQISNTLITNWTWWYAVSAVTVQSSATAVGRVS